MFRISYLILLFIAFTNKQGVSQACKYGSSVEDATKLCNFHQGKNFASNKDAETALDKVLAVTGMSKRYVLLPCSEIENCMATSYKGIRYILYDPEFMVKISTYTSDWSGLAILAHEIGHHVNGHAVDASITANRPSLRDSREMELEADEFSGFVMYKLGASLSDAQRAVNLIASDGDDSSSTHPSRQKRLLAISKGYNRAAQSSNPNMSNLEPEDVWLERGAKLYEDSKYEEAVAELDKVIQVTESNELAYFYRGMCKYWYPIMDYDGAIADLTKAIELNPAEAWNYYWRGMAYKKSQQTGRYGKALSDFNAAIKLNQNEAELFLARGTVKQARFDDYDGAIKDFTRCIELNPENVDYYKERASAYWSASDYRNTIKDYNIVLNAEPKNHQTFRKRGRCKWVQKDYYGAIADFTRAIELTESDPYRGHDTRDYYEVRAEAKLGLGDVQGAINDVNASIEIDFPRGSWSFTVAALIKCAAEDYSGALEEVKLGIKTFASGDDDNEWLGNFLFIRGIVKFKMGNTEDGCIDLQRVKTLVSKRAWSYNLDISSSIYSGFVGNMRNEIESCVLEIE